MNIIDKIKKLLALGSNNTSEEEMAAAMAKAAELAIKNGLDIEAIKADNNDDDVLDDFYVGKCVSRVSAADMELWERLAKVFGAKCLLTTYKLIDGRRRQELHVVAPKGVKETLLYLGRYLQREAQRRYLGDKRELEFYCMDKTEKSIRKAFLWGFAVKITARVRQLFSVQCPDCKALVLICSERVNRKVNEMSGGAIKELGDPGIGMASLAGMIAADETEIRRPLAEARGESGNVMQVNQ